jgi:hypothetical protein
MRGGHHLLKQQRSHQRPASPTQPTWSASTYVPLLRLDVHGAIDGTIAAILVTGRRRHGIAATGTRL